MASTCTTTPVAYFHIRPQHLLVHAAPGYLLWSKRNRPFKAVHLGSWPVMWRCSDIKESDAFIRIVEELPVIKPSNESSESSSRYIPREVRESVLDRDEGKCRVCKSTTNLHFDRILPFCRGGDNSPENVQILCGRHFREVDDAHLHRFYHYVERLLARRPPLRRQRFHVRRHLHQPIVAHFNSSWAVRVRRDDLLTIQVDGTKGTAVAGLRHCWTQHY